MKKLYKDKERKSMKSKNELIAKRRKKMQVRRSIFLSIIIIVGIVVFMFKAPIFNVKTINIKGTLTVDKGTIAKKLNGYIGLNIFSISNNEIEKKISEDPYIKNVISKKTGINNIEITILEEPVNYYIDGEMKKIISNEGVLLEEVETIGERYLVSLEGVELQNGEVSEKIVTNESTIEAMKSLSEIIRNNESTYVLDTIDLKDSQNISVKIKEFTIKIGDCNNLKDKFNKIFNIMDQQGLIDKKGYIDISSEEAPVIKIEE